MLGEAHGDHPPHNGEPELGPVSSSAYSLSRSLVWIKTDTLRPGIAVAADVSWWNYFSEVVVRMFHQRAALSTAEHSAALTLSVKLGLSFSWHQLASPLSSAETTKMSERGLGPCEPLWAKEAAVEMPTLSEQGRCSAQRMGC